VGCGPQIRYIQLVGNMITHQSVIFVGFVLPSNPFTYLNQSMIVKPTIYLETSIVSYLTARLSKNLVTAAHQQLTQEWWQNQRDKFALFTSQLVIQEASRGDQSAAQRRLEILKDIPLLEMNYPAIVLAREWVDNQLIPKKATEDALHIAIATLNGMNYLLTWNCKHIANATMRHKREVFCRLKGHESPVICTPEELIEE